MAVVNAIADLAAWLGWYVVPFILILSLIVSIHELGHYLVGPMVRRQNRCVLAWLRP